MKVSECGDLTNVNEARQLSCSILDVCAYSHGGFEVRWESNHGKAKHLEQAVAEKANKLVASISALEVKFDGA